VTTEEDFQARLDARPDDDTARLVYADWLEERGDPRAEGYRAMGARGMQPLGIIGGWWGWARTTGQSYGYCVAGEWYDAMPRERRHSRREAEDAAALAFAKLPLHRRQELLQIPAETRS
jgi:uncharacterized protein (TIGR02996 family)